VSVDCWGRPPCWQSVCRGYDICGIIGCGQATCDELLWALFGWLWLFGGRGELDTWAPDEMRVANVDWDELDEIFEVGA
jgi:hypothetical protein